MVVSCFVEAIISQYELLFIWRPVYKRSSIILVILSVFYFTNHVFLSSSCISLCPIAGWFSCASNTTRHDLLELLHEIFIVHVTLLLRCFRTKPSAIKAGHGSSELILCDYIWIRLNHLEILKCCILLIFIISGHLILLLSYFWQHSLLWTVLGISIGVFFLYDCIYELNTLMMLIWILNCNIVGWNLRKLGWILITWHNLCMAESVASVAVWNCHLVGIEVELVDLPLATEVSRVVRPSVPCHRHCLICPHISIRQQSFSRRCLPWELTNSSSGCGFMTTFRKPKRPVNGLVKVIFIADVAKI